ncbi:hypothetical protein [Halegenticoccus soli]|uniref:hypothetical protein n=1 Tax=Halegenticoccus soli TaxID=1985678 RepID=UPI000C6DBDAA|nr:hypothetical protein [Halegenticoccus soli]
MGLPGVTDSSTYEGLKDVLQRQPEVTSVNYEPNSISKRFLRATIDPNRVSPSTGPEPPALDVEWRYADGDTYYRIHYFDPNTGFNCGWHRDEDHPELGPVHFQSEHPEMGKSDHKSAHFSKSAPTEVLWEAVEQLFEELLPTLSG